MKIEDIPQSILIAYKNWQEVDLYYTDTQNPAIIDEERRRQAEKDGEAEAAFHQVCEAAGYPHYVYDSSAFMNLLETWYENYINNNHNNSK